MRENYEQLLDGYENALDTLSELNDTVSEVQESVVDALSDVHADLQSLLCTLRLCLKILSQTAENKGLNAIF